MREERTKKSGRLKIVIIILIMLLVLSAGGLAARMIYLHFFAPTQTTAAVPDNLIGNDTNQPEENAASGSNMKASVSVASEPGPVQTDGTTSSSTVPGSTGTDKPTQAKALELYAGKPGDNQKFEIRNMFPGDTETKYFCIRAYHNKDIELFFKADITGQTKALGEVLHIKVTHLETGKVLCDAPFNEINGAEFSELLKVNGTQATIAYYQIDVSLDTSVGNEYQTAQLRADFSWYVKDTGDLTPPPQTGDSMNIALWIVLAGSSLLLVMLLWNHRRKEGEPHGEA